MGDYFLLKPAPLVVVVIALFLFAFKTVLEAVVGKPQRALA